MLRVIFTMLMAIVAFAGVAVAYVAWVAYSPITQNAVETRFYQGCMVAYAVQTASPAKMSQRPLSSAICTCFSTGAVEILGVAQAAQLADQLRQRVVETARARITGEKEPDIRTPESRMLIVQLEHAGTAAYRMCGP